MTGIRYVRRGYATYGGEFEFFRGAYNGKEYRDVWGVYHAGKFWGTCRTVREAVAFCEEIRQGKHKAKW